MPAALSDYYTIGAATREWLVSPATVTHLAAYGFTLVGWTRACAGYDFVRTSPPFGQVKVTLEGEGEALVDGEWRPATPGTAYLSPPRALSAFRVPPGGSWTIAWVHFINAQFVFPEPASRLVPAEGEALFWPLRGLCAEAAGAADEGALASWTQLVATATRRLLGPPPGDLRLRALWQAVAGDPAYPWSSHALARRIGISAEHLRRLTLHETGRTPMAQVAHLRMRHAAALLTSGRYSVASVAERVGYDNPFAFSTAFRRAHGVPPSRLRGSPVP